MAEAHLDISIGLDVFFLLMGAILVFAMHGGFAFLEVGTVRHKNQVNALVKILVDFAVSTLAYFIIGYYVAYGAHFFVNANILSGNIDGTDFQPQGLSLVKFFFLATFAAAIPAIISGGIAERAKFLPQVIATAAIVGFFYPIVEGAFWNGNFGIQKWLNTNFGAEFHDFAGSAIVHAFGGWLALISVILLGPRMGRYTKSGKITGILPSSIPWLALGSWMLCIGWFGFNVISSATTASVSGLVAINSLMAMVGGILTSVLIGKNDPGFTHNGALAGLVAVCAGSDIMHPLGSLFVGGVAGAIFVYMFDICQNKLKIDDVLGVWPLHGLCGLWGGVSAGVFGLEFFGGLGGVNPLVQVIGTFTIVFWAIISGLVIYGLLKVTVGIRLAEDDEHKGADLAIHKITATPETDIV